MTLTRSPGVRRRLPAGAVAWILAVVAVLVAGAVIVVLLRDGSGSPTSSSDRGSGVSVTDAREVPAFTSVDLAGANTVVIHVGPARSVAVVGDDDLVEQVTTTVRAGRLVIDNQGSFTTNAPMHVAVSVPSLDGVAIGGAGTVTVDGVESGEFTAELAGDGTLVASGTAQSVTAELGGAGTLDLHDLVASDATARLAGTGTIRVHATATLDATLTGTGTISYAGEPAVTTHNTGTGAVVAE